MEDKEKEVSNSEFWQQVVEEKEAEIKWLKEVISGILNLGGRFNGRIS